MFVRLKMDLVKYYLVTCFKAKNKVKLMEFFTKYSKEILSYGSVKVLSCNGANNSTAYKGNNNGSNVGMMNGVNSTLSNSTNTGMMGGNNTGGIGDVALDSNGSSFIHNNHANSIFDGSENDLRKWYVLPYLEHPANDREFMVYFSSTWLDNLKTVLFNYITIVLRSAPAPRLLLIDKWFRSETQMDIRRKIESNTSKIVAYEKAMGLMHAKIEGVLIIMYDSHAFLLLSSPLFSSLLFSSLLFSSLLFFSLLLSSLHLYHVFELHQNEK